MLQGTIRELRAGKQWSEICGSGTSAGSHSVEDRMQFKVEGPADVAGVPVRDAGCWVESRGWRTSKGDCGRSGKEEKQEI